MQEEQKFISDEETADKTTGRDKQLKWSQGLTGSKDKLIRWAATDRPSSMYDEFVLQPDTQKVAKTTSGSKVEWMKSELS